MRISSRTTKGVPPRHIEDDFSDFEHSGGEGSEAESESEESPTQPLPALPKMKKVYPEDRLTSEDRAKLKEWWVASQYKDQDQYTLTELDVKHLRKLLNRSKLDLTRKQLSAFFNNLRRAPKRVPKTTSKRFFSVTCM